MLAARSAHYNRSRARRTSFASLSGPLSTYAEPHNYDLCAVHSERLTVPVGWNVIKEEVVDHNTGPTDEDLMAIANAVREVANSDISNKSIQPELGRRGHLRVLPSN